MSSGPEIYPDRIDVTNCENEPIHIIGKSQAHGVILICDPRTFRITQAGENTKEFFGLESETLPGKPVSLFLGDKGVAGLESSLEDEGTFLPQKVEINNSQFLVLAHLSGPNLILDFEPVTSERQAVAFQDHLSRILTSLESAGSVEDLCRKAVVLTKGLFGYDRVMIYRFDEEWNGEVVAEEKEQDLESWLGLHYPATDIPAQSRQMFLKSRVRMITDVAYEPKKIVPGLSPIDGQPPDLSRSVLRAVSPIHIQYLKNMGVGASLTAALIVKGNLWGLLACHHNTAKFLDHYQRESCRFLTQMLSSELTLKEAGELLENTRKTEKIRGKLVHRLRSEDDPIVALSSGKIRFTDLISSGGGAVVMKEGTRLIGETPPEESLSGLIRFLDREEQSIFCTLNLSEVLPEAEAYKDTASGILSLRIAEGNYLLWFRPERVQTVTWGGNPRDKIIYNEEEDRLGPRKSFKKWTEEVKGHSAPWQEIDLNAARALRENIRYILLKRQSREIESLNGRLLEMNKDLELFSYGFSHDLRAPLRGISGYLDIIREDHAEALDREGKELVQMSMDLAGQMDTLIEDILSYSRIGSREFLEQEIKPNALIADVLKMLDPVGNYPATAIEIEEELPSHRGDRRMIFQVWLNLISNAFKYSAGGTSPHIKIGHHIQEGKIIFYVKDNGIGFEAKYAEKIFDTFARAAGSGYEGTGIGLAVVRKIIEKHDGRIWAEGRPGAGAAFYFTVCNRPGIPG